MRRKYDFAISVGGACATTEAMREAGLQWTTLPLDWAGGPTFRQKIDLIAADFSGWLTKSGLRPLQADKFCHELKVQDETLGYLFKHDFTIGVPFDADYERVKAKYDRRIRRFYEQINRSKRILLVWIGVPISEQVPDGDLAYAHETLRRKWPEKQFDILYMLPVAGIPFMRRTDSEADGVRRVTFDYRKPEANALGWQVDIRPVAKWLRSEYEVRDYRTDEERKAWKERQRRTKYARYHATGLFDFLRTRLEYRLFRHLAKKLEPKGIV